MKKLHISIVVALAILLSPLNVQIISANGFPKTAKEEMRGVWVSSVFNIDYPKKPTTDSLLLKREAEFIVKKAKDAGLNAIFLQVRPTADSLYKSSIFPYSKWLTGKAGLAPSDGFDPLQYFIELAHKEGMELHAWLNPYRVTKRSNGETVSIQGLPDGHPAKLRPELVKFHEGNLYFDPGLPEARTLIADGVAEIVKNYDVDGIHFDDYFYPGTDFADEDTYKTYGGSMDKGNWRRQNVNLMVKEVYDRIKSIKPAVSFGISPFGIWQNKSSNPAGSATSGNQSYSAHYADSLYWIKNGIIDYINPQIYWEQGFKVADYQVLARWWNEQVKGTKVKLYIGHAAYKGGVDDADSPWHGEKEILSQLKFNEGLSEVDGSIFFSMKSLLNQPVLLEKLGVYYGAGFDKLKGFDSGVYSPEGDITTSASSYYIGGLSNPNYPLTVNGKEVTGRSINGFFGFLAELEYGSNTFVFKNGDSTFSRTITRSDGAGGGSDVSYLDSPKILKESCYPQKQAVIRDGESITFECIAPSGATVYAEVAGHKVPLERIWGSSNPSLEKAKYRGVFKPIQFFNNIEMYDYGNVTYNMYYNGTKSSEVSNSGFIYAAERAKFYVSVTSDDLDLTITPDSSDGSREILQKSMIESVARTDGKIVKLGNGAYANYDYLALSYGLSGSAHKVDFISYELSDDADIITLGMEDMYAVHPRLEGNKVIIEVASPGSMQNIVPKDGAMVLSSKAEIINSRGYYTLTLKDTSNYGGTFVEHGGKQCKIYLRKKPKVSLGPKPLTNIKIMIDPGHGGSDSGALGLLGSNYSEKIYSLDISKKLKSAIEAAGGTVYMTRLVDEDISLHDRLRESLKIKPHLFISVHANSASMTKNLSEIRGFSVYRSRELAKPIADLIQYQVIEKLGRNDRDVLLDDFYVIRGEWSPAILLEAGFMPNPEDFDWLKSDKAQNDYVRQIMDAIYMYFSNGGR